MPDGATTAGAALRLDGIDVAIDGAPILTAIDWTVAPGERWVVVGPNGSGKTTLLRLAAAWLRPSAGTAEVLGETLGRTDMRALRGRIGFTSLALSDQLRPSVSPHDVVLTASKGALESWWHRYDDRDHQRATEQLEAFGIDRDTAARPLRTLSAGERQRVLLARAFAGHDGLVVLDEPTAGLDVGGREDLVRRLDVAATGTDAALVLVTHHLEEIPPSFDRVILLRDGRVAAAGAASDELTSDALSSLYGVDLDVRLERGRWSAVAAG